MTSKCSVSAGSSRCGRASGETSRGKSQTNVGSKNVCSASFSKISRTIFPAFHVGSTGTPWRSASSARSVSIERDLLAGGRGDGPQHRDPAEGRREVQLPLAEREGERALDRLRARSDQVLGDPHHRPVVAVGLVQLEHGEFRVVLPVDAFVAEVPADLVDALQAAHQQPLEVQLQRDPQLEVGIERVVMGRERLGQRPTGHGLQDRRLHLRVPAIVELAADRPQHGGARRDVLTGRRVGDEVQVAPPLLEIGVLQAMPFLRERTERLRQHGERIHLERQLAPPRPNDVPGGADDIAEVDLLEQPVARAERRLLAEELQVAGAIADHQERQLPVPPGQDDPSGDGRAAVRLLLVLEPVLELGEEIRGVGVDVEAHRERLDAGVPQSLQRLTSRAEDLGLARQALVRLELTHRRSRRSARRPDGVPPT